MESVKFKVEVPYSLIITCHCWQPAVSRAASEVLSHFFAFYYRKIKLVHSFPCSRSKINDGLTLQTTAVKSNDMDDNWSCHYENSASVERRLIFKVLEQECCYTTQLLYSMFYHKTKYVSFIFEACSWRSSNGEDEIWSWIAWSLKFAEWLCSFDWFCVERSLFQEKKLKVL